MKNKKIILVVAILIILVSAIVYYSIKKSSKDLSENEMGLLIKCLNEKKIYLYGTINCPNCDVQKRKFGNLSKDIIYINCFVEEERCEKYSKQKVYPFWGFDDEVIVGPISLSKLKSLTGC